jgi:hypothetical protein
MKRIVNRDKCAKYITITNFCTFERAKELIDDGVENLPLSNIKYLGYGKFEILYK